jgi:hypothetical protein
MVADCRKSARDGRLRLALTVGGYVLI